MNGILIYGVIFIFAVFFVSGLAELGIGERESFREEFRISPLVAAKSAGIVIISAAFKIFYDERLSTRIISLIVLFFSFVLMLITASRAALLFLIIVMVIFYSLSNDGWIKKITIIAASTILISISFVIISQLNLQIIQRLEDLRNLEQTLRFVRLEMIAEMVKNFEMGIWGLGPYGFGHLTGLNYPHNYIAELVVDYGLLGAVSALLFVTFGLYYSYKIINDKYSKEQAFLGVLFVYLFLTSLTSGDIVEARHMQFVAILLMNHTVYTRKTVT
jgi:O-antigen ligase